MLVFLCARLCMCSLSVDDCFVLSLRHGVKTMMACIHCKWLETSSRCGCMELSSGHGGSGHQTYPMISILRIGPAATTCTSLTQRCHSQGAFLLCGRSTPIYSCVPEMGGRAQRLLERCLHIQLITQVTGACNCEGCCNDFVCCFTHLWRILRRATI